MAQVKLNVKELKDFLKKIIEGNKQLQAKGLSPTAVNIEGEAGLGKTSAVGQLSKELGLDYVKLNLAQIEELGDLVGFPIKQFEMAINKGTETEPQWVKEWVDEPMVESHKERGYQATNKSRMGYCPPEWIAGKSEGGILLLDDYSRADVRFQQACMELIQHQEYISWKLPKNWHIMLSTNPDNGDYNVQSEDEAQKTRRINIVVKFDVDCWAEWAENSGIDGRCINFMLMNPELISDVTANDKKEQKTKVNSRSASMFFNAISTFPDFTKDLPMIQMIGEGSVGEEMSTLFTQFINNNLDKLVDPKTMVLDTDGDTVLQKIRACVGEGDSYRADIASVLATRISNFSLKYAKENPVSPAMQDRLVTLLTEQNLFTDDLRYNMSSQIINGNKMKFQKLMMNKDVIAMVAR